MLSPLPEVSTNGHPPVFRVLHSASVQEVFDAHLADVQQVVRAAYLRYAAGFSVNPASHFLRFPDHPRDRIIALPARDRNERADRAGIKWISSFPGNVEAGLPRASAVIILNDMGTGFPIACLEASAISAARTAASAALAARVLHPTTEGQVLGIVGCGPIARAVHQHLRADGWSFREIVLVDLVPARAEAFRAGLEEDVRIVPSVQDALDAADLMLFATTAAEPHFLDADGVHPRHTILHLSLRDLGVGVLHRAQNIVDDPAHAIRESTSLGLAVERYGAELIAGTLAQVISAEVPADPHRPRIFSPFGLGVLDLAVAGFVYDHAVRAGTAIEVHDFYAPPS